MLDTSTLCTDLSKTVARILVVAAAFTQPHVHAQELGNLVTFVVGYPAGGQSDVAARLVAEKMQAELGRAIIVENRPGAGGQIAARYVKDRPGNGATLFVSNSHTVVTVPKTLKDPGFDAEADFRPLGPVAKFELVLVAHPKSKAASVTDLANYFRENPGSRNIAVPSPGSVPEFIAGRLAQLMKLDIVPVAYRGSPPALQDLLGGQVTAGVLPLADVLPSIKAGQLNALAITHQTTLLPQVPSFADIGYPELGVSEFVGVYAPTSLPDALAQKFSRAIQSVVSNPQMISRLLEMGYEPAVGGPAELQEMYKTANAMVKKLVNDVGYTPQ